MLQILLYIKHHREFENDICVFDFLIIRVLLSARTDALKSIRNDRFWRGIKCVL